MIDPGHDRFETGVAHDIEHGLVVDGDDDASDIGLRRPPGNLDDHRQAADIGERFARQTCGSHARRNEHDGFA
ncbi:hypothetical protein D3C87_2138200 [compost metagenome]